MVTDEDIESVLKDHCLSFAYRKLPKGHYRVDTKLLYPDGASIGVFVERGEKAKIDGVALSDFGGAFMKLLEHQLPPAQGNRLRTIEETISPLGVSIIGDRLSIEVDSASRIPDGIISLSQACLRTSCLIFIRRTSQQRSLREEIKASIKDIGLPFDEKYRFDLPNLRPITVDYRVRGPHHHTSILSLGATHAQAIEVFRKWFDLRRFNVQDRLVTIYDESHELEQNEDLVRLEVYSDVISLSNRRGLERSLTDAA